MARGKTVTLETRSFATRAEATSFFSEMLSRYEPGDRVAEKDAVDLGALLKLHPEYEGKIAGGLDHFAVMMTQHTPCFCIVRSDGTTVDFSFGKCIRNSAG